MNIGGLRRRGPEASDSSDKSATAVGRHCIHCIYVVPCHFFQVVVSSSLCACSTGGGDKLRAEFVRSSVFKLMYKF